MEDPDKDPLDLLDADGGASLTQVTTCYRDFFDNKVGLTTNGNHEQLYHCGNR